MTGFLFNQAALNGVDAPLRSGLRKYLSAREREINSTAKRRVNCVGGPFGGQTIDLDADSNCSATFTVGKWSGRYVAQGIWAEWSPT